MYEKAKSLAQRATQCFDQWQLKKQKEGYDNNLFFGIMQ